MKRKYDKTRINSLIRRFPVKERIFLYYMVFFAALALLTVATNILYGLNFSYNYKWIGIFVFCAIMGPLAAKGFHTDQVHRFSVYTIAFVILPLSWLSSSGLVSPSIVYSIVVMLLINFLLVGIERFIVNILFLLLNMALIALYSFYPGIFKTMTDQEQFLDWIINVPIVFAFIALLLIIFERAYEKERIINLKKTKKLEVISKTDPLTGLLNRLNLENDIDVLLREFREKGTVFSMIIIDIDFFKEYNDTYGHQKGDDCLREIGSILKSSIHRINDMAYRFGGEEFLIILSETDLSGAVEFAQKLQKEIRSAAISHKTSKVAPIVSVSMGISASTKGQTNGAALLKQSDKALYQAKEQGRDRIVSARTPEEPRFRIPESLHISCLYAN